MDASHRADARQAPSGAQDDCPVNLIPQDGVRAANVVRLGRGDGGSLDPQAGLQHGCGCILYHRVLCGPPVFQAEVKVFIVQLESDPPRGLGKLQATTAAHGTSLRRCG